MPRWSAGRRPNRCRASAASASRHRPPAPSVNSKTITAVPLTTRNFTQILSMASGSAADVNNAGTLGRGTRSVNVNGNTSAGSYTLDGAVAPSAVPNPDTISELKIQTSQYDAVYGAQVPSTALITKSGEHEFHGDAWEFVRNDVFNANSYFRGGHRAVQTQSQAAPVRRHRWAARSAAGSSSSSAPTRARGRSTDWIPLRPPTRFFRR